MAHLDFEDTEIIDDLARLRGDVSDFFKAYDAYQWAYCEEEDCTAIALLAEDKLDSIKRRIRHLAIDFGLHAEFLQEFSQIQQKLAA